MLQPQSEIAKVRAFLLQEGFSIIKEDMVEEDGKYYPMMKVISKQAASLWTEEELHYGKLLLEDHHPVLKEFLLREKEIRERILEGFSGREGERLEKRSREIRNELELIEKALARYSREE